jgi:uncharacterized protein
MKIFVDTSAIYAFLDAGDNAHAVITSAWQNLAENDHTFVTSNYVLLESVVLLQNRIGLDAARDFAQNIATLFEVIWIDQVMHDTAVATMLMAGRRDLSLVDCVSFMLMRQTGLQQVLTTDKHFREQGFDVVP